jgi:predicted transposase/invertase (TIGR01784 family)
MSRYNFPLTNDRVARKLLAAPCVLKSIINSTLDLNVISVAVDSDKSFRPIVIVSEDEDTDNKLEIHFTEVDVYATLEDGSRIIVEVQVASQSAYVKRALLYAFDRYADKFDEIRPLVENNLIAYDKLEPIYMICILVDNYFKDAEPIHNFQLQDIATNQPLFIDKTSGKVPFALAFWELKKYNEDKLSEPLKHWFQFWNNIEMDPDIEEEIKYAETIVEQASMDPKEKTMIDRQVKLEEDWKAIKQYARDSGLAEGLERGRSEGIKQAKIENAKKMKADGLDLKLIQKYTQLPIETIESL